MDFNKFTYLLDRIDRSSGSSGGTTIKNVMNDSYDILALSGVDDDYDIDPYITEGRPSYSIYRGRNEGSSYTWQYGHTYKQHNVMVKGDNCSYAISQTGILRITEHCETILSSNTPFPTAYISSDESTYMRGFYYSNSNKLYVFVSYKTASGSTTINQSTYVYDLNKRTWTTRSTTVGLPVYQSDSYGNKPLYSYFYYSGYLYYIYRTYGSSSSTNYFNIEQIANLFNDTAQPSITSIKYSESSYGQYWYLIKSDDNCIIDSTSDPTYTNVYILCHDQASSIYGTFFGMKIMIYKTNPSYIPTITKKSISENNTFGISSNVNVITNGKCYFCSGSSSSNGTYFFNISDFVFDSPIVKTQINNASYSSITSGATTIYKLSDDAVYIGYQSGSTTYSCMYKNGVCYPIYRSTTLYGYTEVLYKGLIYHMISENVMFYNNTTKRWEDDDFILGAIHEITSSYTETSLKFFVYKDDLYMIYQPSGVYKYDEVSKRFNLISTTDISGGSIYIPPISNNDEIIMIKYIDSVYKIYKFNGSSFVYKTTIDNSINNIVSSCIGSFILKNDYIYYRTSLAIKKIDINTGEIVDVIDFETSKTTSLIDMKSDSILILRTNSSGPMDSYILYNDNIYEVTGSKYKFSGINDANYYKQLTIGNTIILSNNINVLVVTEEVPAGTSINGSSYVAFKSSTAAKLLDNAKLYLIKKEE